MAWQIFKNGEVWKQNKVKDKRLAKKQTIKREKVTKNTKIKLNYISRWFKHIKEK